MNNKDLAAYPATTAKVKDNGVIDHTFYMGLTKLEAFTMAAMQGLCNEATIGSEHVVADLALSIAQATLEALEKVK